MKTLRHFDKAHGRPLWQAQGRLLRHICLLAFVLLVVNPLAAASDEKLAFWSEQRKGANGDGRKDPQDWFSSAGKLGLQFVRLSPLALGLLFVPVG
ncbi:MAG: hypothetical protein WAV28_09875 [Sedimentisphaerales bacterium]|jgi:hypothetical protein